MMLDNCARCGLVLAVVLTGCRDRVELARVPWAEIGGTTTQSTQPTVFPEGGSACEQALASACVNDSSQACRDASSCMLDNAMSVDGYCAVQGGADICDGPDISLGYIEFCRIEACFGADFTACLDEGRAECKPGFQPPPPPPPPPASTCARIESLAASCPGYAYDCPAHPQAQSECFLAVLESLTDRCMLFDELDLLCANRHVTIEGAASCMIQECFALTTYDACYGNLEILCDWIP